MDERLDCVVIGYNDFDLQILMAEREAMKESSGAYRQMLGSVFRSQGRWLHHVDFLNAVLREAIGRDYRLHTMELPNLALCYLKSFLSRRGFSAEIVNFYNREKDTLTRLLKKAPRAVAITTTLYFENGPISEMVDFVRAQNAEAAVIVGGPHILNMCSTPHAEAQDYLLNEIGADVYVVESQGEETLAALLGMLRDGRPENLRQIPNLVYRGGFDKAGGGGAAAAGAGFVRTPRRAEDNDMDEDAIDWSVIRPERYTPTAQMRISRSCPFSCSFCRYPIIAGPSRRSSVDTVEREMRQFRDAGVKTLILTDDTPNVPGARFKEILKRMIANQFEFDWFSNLRSANADEEMFDLLYAARCRGVFLGIESGDQTILDNMNKKASVDRYKTGIEQLKKRGIVTYASFIVGFPGETEETFRNTVNFIRETQPDYYQAHLYFHSRNVPIQNRAAEFGLRGSEYSWRHDTMDWRRACDLLDTMRRTIDTSVLCTSYLSSFWLIAYLYGKGISLKNIRSFLAACKPALLANLAPDPAGTGGAIGQELLAAGRRISEDLSQRDSNSQEHP